jgi:hypothetical protein
MKRRRYPADGGGNLELRLDALISARRRRRAAQLLPPVAGAVLVGGVLIALGLPRRGHERSAARPGQPASAVAVAQAAATTPPLVVPIEPVEPSLAPVEPSVAAAVEASVASPTAAPLASRERPRRRGRAHQRGAREPLLSAAFTLDPF